MLKKKTRDLVLSRDGGLCMVQGPSCLRVAQVVHHRANRGAGGSKALDLPSNLLASCSLCNGWIEDCSGAEREELIRRGVRVLQAATNEQTAERARLTIFVDPDGVVYMLDDAGGKEAVF